MEKKKTLSKGKNVLPGKIVGFLNVFKLRQPGTVFACSQVLKGCLAAKNRFKSKLPGSKYTMTLSKLVAVSKDEQRTTKAAEQRNAESKGKVCRYLVSNRSSTI